MAEKVNKLTLGDLRAFLKTCKKAPDDVKIVIGIWHEFACENEGSDHLQDKHTAGCVTQISACNVLFQTYNENGDMDEGYIPQSKAEKSDGNLDYLIEIVALHEECHDLLAGNCDVDISEIRGHHQ